MNLETPLKVVLELDLAREADRELMQVITQVKGAQAKGQTVSLAAIVNQIQNNNQSSLVTPLEQAGQKLTQATNELQNKIGDDRKLNTRERASVAAKAKWAKYRAEKAGLPTPAPAPRKKKLKKKEFDMDGAERLDHSTFELKEAEEDFGAFDGTKFKRVAKPKAPIVPDGREILEGEFDDEESEEEIEHEDDSDIQLSDEYRRGLHDKANDFSR